MASSLDDFPVLTSVRVVCRECLSFRELKHINVLTNEFLRMGSIREACLHGSLRLMRLVASRDTKSHWGDVAEIAAKRGHLDILQWLSEFHADRCKWDNVLDLAAEFGHLPVVKWLHTHRQDKCTTKAMDKAAALGHLDVVKWLHTNRSEGCSTEAMDRAAFLGYFDVVEWLHNNRTEGCTERAMAWTVMYGHLDQVKWLHANTTKGCSPYIMDEVTDLEMIKWLHENLSGGELCSTRAMDKAAELGRLDLVNWLYENRTEGYSIHAIELAARNGHLDVVKWLFDHEGDKRRYRCQGLRVNCFSLHLMYCFQGLNDFILKMARESGQQHVVEWVESLDEPETTTELWCVVSRE